MKRLHYVLLVLFVLSALGIGSCSSPKGRDAQDFLPEDSAYNTADTTDITNALAAFEGAAALLTANTDFVLQISFIQETVDCLNKSGGIAARVYSHKTYPEVAGLVLVINRDRLLSLETIRQCLTPDIPLLAERPKLKPCADAWEYTDDATYYFLYAGTSSLVCDLFAAKLPHDS